MSIRRKRVHVENPTEPSVDETRWKKEKRGINLSCRYVETNCLTLSLEGREYSGNALKFDFTVIIRVKRTKNQCLSVVIFEIQLRSDAGTTTVEISRLLLFVYLTRPRETRNILSGKTKHTAEKLITGRNEWIGPYTVRCES